MDCFSNNFSRYGNEGDFMNGTYTFFDFQQSPSSVQLSQDHPERRHILNLLPILMQNLNDDSELDDKMTRVDTWGAHSTPMTQGQIAGNSGYGTQGVQGYQMNGGAHVNPYQQDSTQYAPPPVNDIIPPAVTNHSPVLEMTSEPFPSFNPREVEDILNAERDNIDTKVLCQKISVELSARNISQELFSARILNRSQGTLSDLLGKPRPWSSLKSGRKTYTRMYNWMSQPLETRMVILHGGPLGEVKVAASTPTHKKSNKRKSEFAREEPIGKKTRLVFTEIQKKALQNIFKETQRPNKERKKKIAEHLRLDVSTVHNFFMNARRRSNAAKAAKEQNSLQ